MWRNMIDHKTGVAKFNKQAKRVKERMELDGPSDAVGISFLLERLSLLSFLIKLIHKR